MASEAVCKTCKNNFYYDDNGTVCKKCLDIEKQYHDVCDRWYKKEYIRLTEHQLVVLIDEKYKDLKKKYRELKEKYNDLIKDEDVKLYE